MPFALQQKVEAELDRLKKQGVIKPVQFTKLDLTHAHFQVKLDEESK